MIAQAGMPFFFALGAMLCGLLVFVEIIVFFYCLTLFRALKKCSPRNRTMEPGLVWLNLVPILHFFWGFRNVNNVCRSLRYEFINRDLDNGGDYGMTIGIAAMALHVASSAINFVLREAGIRQGDLLGYLSSLLALSALILFIIYWVQIAGYSRQLSRDSGGKQFARDDDIVPRERRGPTSTDIQSKEKDDRYTSKDKDDRYM
jgi:hypothetical protein